MKILWVLMAFLPLTAQAAPEEKVVALGGDVTEIVFALGAQSSLVARDSTSQWPAAATALPDVGYLRQLNAEGIPATRPTLVLASAQAQPSLVLEQLKQSQAQGEALRQTLRRALAELPSSELNKRVLFILNHGGMTAMAAGQQTGADAAIRAAGLRNAMQGFTRYQPLSQEGVIASQPDLVVISQDGVNAMGVKIICGRCRDWRKRPLVVISRCCRLTIWHCWVLACVRRRPSSNCVPKRSNCPDATAYHLLFVDAGRYAGRDDDCGYRFWRIASAGKPFLARGRWRAASNLAHYSTTARAAGTGDWRFTGAGGLCDAGVVSQSTCRSGPAGDQ